MKDETTKKLLQESLLHTSDDFTDLLMQKIELEVPPVSIPLWQHIALVACIGVFLSAIGFLFLQAPLRWPTYGIGFPPLPLQLAGSMFVLLALNAFLRFRTEMRGA